MACCVPEIGADARVDDGDVEEKSLILESRVVVKSAPASVVICMYVCTYVCMYVLNCT